jgi:hypothetical protein
MRYLINNPNFAFITAIQVQVPEGEILEVRLRVARTNIPRRWDYPSFKLRRFQRAAVLILERPSNWPRIELDVIAPKSSTFSFGLVTVPTKTDEEIRMELSQKSIALLGLARDCQDAVLASIEILRSVGSLFGKHVIHICENDSIDQTDAQLQPLADTGRITLHSFPGLSSTLTRRTERLAFLRNYLNEIATSMTDLDYVFWMDMDSYSKSELSLKGLLSCFQCNDAWDAVFPAMNGFYYDIWALRHKRMWPSDCMIDINSEWDLALGSAVVSQAPVHVRQIAAHHLCGWLPVDSAFGGMAIYKADACRNGRYVGLIDEQEVCEHVSFNQSIVENGGKLWINPEFRVDSPLPQPSPF